MSSEHDEEEVLGVSGKWFMLLLLGIALVFVGVAIIVIASLVLGGSGGIGGVILIGPIPIVFGAGENSTWLILIGVVISIISVAVYVLSRRSRKE